MSYTTLQAMTYVLYKYAFILNLALSYKKKNWIYVFFTFLKVQPRYPNSKLLPSVYIFNTQKECYLTDLICTQKNGRFEEKKSRKIHNTPHPSWHPSHPSQENLYVGLFFTCKTVRELPKLSSFIFLSVYIFCTYKWLVLQKLNFFVGMRH